MQQQNFKKDIADKTCNGQAGADMERRHYQQKKRKKYLLKRWTVKVTDGRAKDEFEIGERKRLLTEI